MQPTDNLRRLLWAGVLLAVAWRVLAFVYPHPAATDPPLVQRATALMGLWFLACGLVAFRRAPGRASWLFAWYGVAACLHWGGPLGLGSEAARNLLLAFYIVASSALAQSLFLHVALAFEPPREAAESRGFLTLIYAPVLVGVLLLVALLVQPSNSSILETLPILILTATLCSVAGAGVWIARFLKAKREERRARRLGLVVAAIVVGWLPYLLVSSGLSPWPGYEGLFNLPMALEPTAVALALIATAQVSNSSAC